MSLGQAWSKGHSRHGVGGGKSTPNSLFFLGRITAYALLGGLLGVVGGFLGMIRLTPFLIIPISLLMILTGLKMLGVNVVGKLPTLTPKTLTGKIGEESKSTGYWAPLLIGAATVFLPCGFTLTAQGLAVISGNLIQGALIMLAFVLGTTGPLLAIAVSSVRLYEKPHLARQFAKFAGILIVFFGLHNLNAQLNVLGITSLSDISATSAANQLADRDLAPLVNGRQLITMEALAFDYQPNYFKVRAGLPVRWEISDRGASGCTNAIISKDLFPGEIPLQRGQTAVKEFTPEKAGRYKFSCWMGMVSGVIEVVDESGRSGAAANSAPSPPSPASPGSCGCSGACGGSCGTDGCPYAQ